MHPTVGSGGGVRLYREATELCLPGVSQDLGNLEFLDGIAGVRGREVEKSNDGRHQEQPHKDRLRIHAGSVFIIIRLVVLTHWQRF